MPATPRDRSRGGGRVGEGKGVGAGAEAGVWLGVGVRGRGRGRSRLPHSSFKQLLMHLRTVGHQRSSSFLLSNCSLVHFSLWSASVCKGVDCMLLKSVTACNRYSSMMLFHPQLHACDMLCLVMPSCSTYVDARAAICLPHCCPEVIEISLSVHGKSALCGCSPVWGRVKSG